MMSLACPHFEVAPFEREEGKFQHQVKSAINAIHSHGFMEISLLKAS